MTKLIFALHADDAPALHTALLDPGFRDRVSAAGATRLQLNLDDADVADAPLRFGPGTPIVAVVSVWLDGPVADLVDAVRELDPRADGWRVDERRPIEPPEVPDGVRAEALSNLAFLRRPATMSPQDWLDDWLERHTSVAIDTQGTFGYVQNPVVEAVTGPSDGSSPDGPPSDVAGIVEELFPMAAMTDTHAFYGSGGDDAELERRFSTLMESVARFGADHGLDLVPTSRYQWSL